MGLGSNLIQRGPVWWFIYSPEETKNGRFLEVQFPEALLPWLAKYSHHYRPLLAGSRYRGDRVWVSITIGRNGTGPSTRRSCGSRKRRSAGAFLRTCSEIASPHHSRSMTPGIVNSLATTERFYNLAQTLEVGRLVGDTLARLRSKLQAA